MTTLTNLTASQAVQTNASQQLISIANTGTGNNVLATSPTLVTPNIGVASGTSLNLSGLTASSSVQTDASKNLISVTNTGTGNNVMSASPTLTGTLNCAGISGTLNFATTGFLEGTRLNISRTETGGQTVGTFLQPNLTGTNRASIFIGKSTSLDQGFTISGGTSKLQIKETVIWILWL